MEKIKLGKYRHYKGREYEVIAVARHSETLEDMVVYKALYGEGEMWVRPLAMFAENIEIDGRILPRFEYIGDRSAQVQIHMRLFGNAEKS